MNRHYPQILNYFFTLFIVTMLAACGGGNGTAPAVITPAASISAIATTTAQSLTVGSAMASFSPLTPSGGATPYTYSITTGTLPAGLSLNASTGAVTGTPTAVYPTAIVIFSVKDANNVAASTISYVLFSAGAASVNISTTATTTAQSLTVGSAMASFSPLTPSGGATPYTYSITTGTLPAGLSLSASTGAVTGTPTAAYAAANVVFSVKDANNVTATTTSSVSFTVANQPTIALFAGDIKTSGNTDGALAVASYKRLRSIGSDTNGNLYVSDDSQSVRKISAAGVVSTLAVGFSRVRDITADAAGNVYVADLLGHAIVKIAVNGDVSILAGLFNNSGNTDGIGSVARFNRPSGLVLNSTGDTLWVADARNYSIRQINLATGDVTTVAGSGALGSANNINPLLATFNNPHGLALNSANDSLYVAEPANSLVRKIAIAAGVFGEVTTLASGFNRPTGVTAIGTDVFVADKNNNRIRKIDTVPAVAVVSDYAGGAPTGMNGVGINAGFSPLKAITSDSAGTIYVADKNAIRKVVFNAASSVGEVTTLSGTTSRASYNDGTGDAASFNTARGLAADAAGNVYVTDLNNHAIRQITPAGVVTTVAGGGGTNVSGYLDTDMTDGTSIAATSGAGARFSKPHGLVADNAGNLYVADKKNHSIRKIVIATGVVSTVAGAGPGMGTGISADGTGILAAFKAPLAITINAAGTELYVAEANSANGANKGQVIRKVVINTGVNDGVVTTLVGAFGVTGSMDAALAADARFFKPTGIATDSQGNLYVADQRNHKIRKITPAGVVSTLAGGGLVGGIAGVSGAKDDTGKAALFDTPVAVATDSNDNVYVADKNNRLIRKITPAGVVTTLAGDMTFQKQNGLALGDLPGTIPQPISLAVSGGKLYVGLSRGVAVITLP